MFSLHRYIGLAVGLLLVIVGLTGSLLVFEPEINDFTIAQQFGRVIPQQQRLAVESVLETVKAAYTDQPDLKLAFIDTPREPTKPYRVLLNSPTDTRTEVFVNPYTGAILGSRLWENSFTGFTLKLKCQQLQVSNHNQGNSFIARTHTESLWSL